MIMSVAYLSALSALAGSGVGGLTSGITTWLGLRAQAKAGQLAREMSRRHDLYKDFIVTASKAYGGALLSEEPQIAGVRRPLRHDQQDAGRVVAANCRER